MSDHDKLIAFAKLAERMRRAQKRFFAGERGQIDAARPLERQLDAEIDRILDPGLFDGEGE